MASKYVLIITEKPDASRRIAKAIADNKPRVVKKRGIFYYQFTVEGRPHIAVPAVGHLFVLLPSKDNPKGWSYPVFNLEWTPTFEKKENAWTERYFKNIEELAGKASEFVNAADMDAEGEVLLFNILRFICKVEDAKRMRFSTLTIEELKESYQNMEPHIMHSLLERGLTRHHLDALWGFNLTRALTIALKSQSEKRFALISTGRVQGPTLAMLLERELEIRAFTPRPFWQVELKVRVDSEDITATYEKEKIWDRDEASKLLESCRGADVLVKEIRKKRYPQKPLIPFNTTGLLSEAYRQFRYSPRRTLNIAESLYQAGAISYPRSSSQKLPLAINYRKILRALAKLKPYASFADQILDQSKIVPNEGKRTDPAHPAIYPTFEVADLKRLTPQQRNIYDLIVRRFLTVFGKVAIRESCKISLDVDGNHFIMIGRRTIEPGWTKCYGKYITLEEQSLPNLETGQLLEVTKVEVLNKETQPPSRYSQGSILRAMEGKNLGTRATRADILQTLYDRQYIVKKNIEVTRLGEVVIEVLKKFSPRIISEQMTMKFEEEIEKVYSGKTKRKRVINEAKEVLVDLLEEFKKSEEKIGKRLLEGLIEARQEQRMLGICLKCGSQLKIVRSRTTGRQFVGCRGYPECANSYPLPQKAMIEKTGKRCGKCGTPIIRVMRGGRRTFTMCIDPDCETKRSWGEKSSSTSPSKGQTSRT